MFLFVSQPLESPIFPQGNQSSNVLISCKMIGILEKNEKLTSLILSNPLSVEVVRV